jgi:hypothetical protein
MAHPRMASVLETFVTSTKTGILAACCEIVYSYLAAEGSGYSPEEVQPQRRVAADVMVVVVIVLPAMLMGRLDLNGR